MQLKKKAKVEIKPISAWLSVWFVIHKSVGLCASSIKRTTRRAISQSLYIVTCKPILYLNFSNFDKEK